MLISLKYYVYIVITCFLFLLLGTTSWLDFGDDLELTNEEITDKELAEVTRRTGIDFPKGKFVECALGRENGKWTVYLSWMST